MKCKISEWGCVYHACMSDDCQKKEVLKNMPEAKQRWGLGKCEQKEIDIIEEVNKDFQLKVLK